MAKKKRTKRRRENRTEVVSVRVSESEYDLIRDAAEELELPTSLWARKELLSAARKTLKRKGTKR